MRWDRNTWRLALLIVNSALLVLPDVVTTLPVEAYQWVKYVAIVAGIIAAALGPVSDLVARQVRIRAR